MKNLHYKRGRLYVVLLLSIFLKSQLHSQQPVISSYSLLDPTTNSMLTAFENSHAILIGIDNYKQVEPRLSSVKSVDVLKNFLNKNHGFQLSNIKTLTNDQATKQNILATLQSLKLSSANDRIVIYFSGRGMTLTGSRGVEEAILLPVNSVIRDYNSATQSSISLNSLKSLLTEIKAKHILVLLDCSIGPVPLLKRYTTAAPVKTQTAKSLQNKVHHFIVAGDRSDIIKDKAATEVSPFVQSFLSSFDVSYTDKNADGAMSGSEVASSMSIRGVVSTSGRVVPQSGYTLDDGGDFVFIAPNPQRQMKINFDAKPSDVTILIDGKRILNLNSPTVITTPAKYLKYLVTRSGYSKVEGEVFADGQTDLFLKFDLLKIPTRDLLVEVNQPDAKIYVNGIYKSKVEKRILLEDVKPGLYNVRADLEGYLSDSVLFDVNEVKTYKHTLKLKSKNGWLSVHSNKGVRIDIDGVFLGSKDVTNKEVTMGGHRVRFYGLGFPETTEEVFVDMTDTVEITKILERPSAGGATWRSLVLPGWGQVYGLRPTTGYIIMGSSFASLGASVWAMSQYNSTNTLYTTKVNEYNDGVKNNLDTNKILILKSERDSLYKSATSNFNVSLITAGVLIACYLYNLSDIFINDPETLYVREEMKALNILDKKKNGVDLALRPRYDGVEIVMSLDF